MDFDERQLRAFIAVAETGSLGRAARIVNLAQPSLSRLIQTMEERLGQRLFDRISRGMAPTQAGDLLLPHARLLVHEMETARAELAALGGLRRGTVRVGAVASVLRILVAEAIGRLLAENPHLRIDAEELVDGELLDALVRRRIDLAITSAPLDHAEVLCLGACAQTDRFAPFAAADHPLFGPLFAPGPPTLADALAQDWVMPGQGSTPRDVFDAMAVDLGFAPPRVVAQTRSTEAMIAISRSSRLLCWLPEPLLAPHLASGTMRQLDIPELTRRRSFWLHRRRAGLLPEAARQFLRHLPQDLPSREGA